MHLDLSELSQLAPIFRELFKGYHVSRRDPELRKQKTYCESIPRAYSGLAFNFCLLNAPPDITEIGRASCRERV